ncbi:MAG: hypothetical protein H6557_24770 [Lewinellaceae bacterium]|nr:hypothetical protein [Phaeodactylibacter sp.]MCB9039846.1 hypothetical protein [Lewinellaceae bacterium]
MSKILLDTNAYSYYLLGDERVLERLAGAALVYMSIFVLGELYFIFEYKDFNPCQARANTIATKTPKH